MCAHYLNKSRNTHTIYIYISCNALVVVVVALNPNLIFGKSEHRAKSNLYTFLLLSKIYSV